MEHLSFFQRAEYNAERTVREWIRKTLRETFLVTMQRHLTVLQQQEPQQNQEQQQQGEEESSVVVRLDNLAGCLRVVQRVSEAWQAQLRKHKHGRTAMWVDDVYTRGQSTLWSKAVPPLSTPGVAEASSEGGSSDDEKEDTCQDNTTEADPTTGEESALVATTSGGPLIPYCELRYLTRPHLKQPNPLQAIQDPVTLLRRLGRQGVSCWPLDPTVIDDLAAEIPKRQRWERTGKRDVNVQVVVPRITDGLDNNTDIDIAEQEEDDEESKRIFSQVLARSRSKIKIPRFRRKRKLEAQRQAEMVRDIPRPASSIGSATYHVQTSLSPTEKEDALRYITPDVEEIDTAVTGSITKIFGFLEDLGKIYRLQEEKKERRPCALTELQQRRREKFYAKERILPRRVQKNHDPGKYKSKILRTEQDMGDGTIKSFLDFDLGWTFLEHTDIDGEKRLMIFSSLQVVVEEIS